MNFRHSLTKSFPVTLGHPNISMWVLQTVPYTSPNLLTRRICLTIKSLLNLLSFSLFSWPSCLIQRRYCCEKLDAHHCVKSFGGFSLKQDKQVSFIAEKLYTRHKLSLTSIWIYTTNPSRPFLYGMDKRDFVCQRNIIICPSLFKKLTRQSNVLYLNEAKKDQTSTEKKRVFT